MKRIALMVCLVGIGAGFAGCARMAPPDRPPDSERLFTATGYCSCGRCCSWHRTWYLAPVDNSTGKRKVVGQTASGTMARVGTIAASPEYPFGTLMYVEGYGYGRVEDRGQAIHGNRLDLWFSTHSSAGKWGRKSVRVKVWLPRDQRGKKTK